MLTASSAVGSRPWSMSHRTKLSSQLAGSSSSMTHKLSKPIADGVALLQISWDKGTSLQIFFIAYGGISRRPNAL